MLIRLTILGLAAYGAKTLYDRYGPKVEELRGPASQFVDRSRDALGEATERTSAAAREAVGAVKDATDEVRRASDDATDEAERRLSSTPGTF
jgi:hypothetical protein